MKQILPGDGLHCWHFERWKTRRDFSQWPVYICCRCGERYHEGYVKDPQHGHGSHAPVNYVLAKAPTGPCTPTK